MTDMGTVVEISGWWVGGSPILAIQLFQVIRYYSNDFLYSQIKSNQAYQIQFRYKHIGREIRVVGGRQSSINNTAIPDFYVLLQVSPCH